MDTGIFDMTHSTQVSDIICGHPYKHPDIYVTRNLLENLNYHVGEMKLKFNIYFNTN